MRVSANATPSPARGTVQGRDFYQQQLKQKVYPMNNDWTKLISGAFGIEDLKFALHPFDQERAAEMLRSALASGVDFKDYYATIETWMRNQLAKKHLPENLLEEHVKEQMSRVCDVSKYFSVNSQE